MMKYMLWKVEELRNKDNLFVIGCFLIINLFIVFISEGDSLRYMAIKFFFPERGVDIALAVLHIAMIVFCLERTVLYVVEIKNNMVVRIGKKAYQKRLFLNWLFFILLLSGVNLIFEQIYFQKMYLIYNIISFLVIAALLPLFIYFIKKDYFYIICISSILLVHIIISTINGSIL